MTVKEKGGALSLLVWLGNEQNENYSRNAGCMATRSATRRHLAASATASVKELSGKWDGWLP
jgi:hypothetical protein